MNKYWLFYLKQKNAIMLHQELKSSSSWLQRPHPYFSAFQCFPAQFQKPAFILTTWTASPAQKDEKDFSLPHIRKNILYVIVISFINYNSLNITNMHHFFDKNQLYLYEYLQVLNYANIDRYGICQDK